VFGDAQGFSYQEKAMYNEFDVSLPREKSMSDARVAFLRSTYAHLAGAILAFIALEFAFVQVATVGTIRTLVGANSPAGPLFVMVLFIGATMLAQALARSESSLGLQYLGLGLCVLAYAVIMLPLLWYVTYIIEDPTLIPTAGILTLAMVGGLTLSVFVTKKDHSGLAPILSVGTLIAVGVIFAGIFFGFHLGLFFSFAMVALMSGWILYETSFVLLHHRTDQPVAAAVMLFASIATLFFYILRILAELNRR
jgi:FtsH-binding integral membrane protein